MPRGIDNFYLQLTLINDEKEKLLNFLKENDMIHEIYPSAWYAYLEEEAECQLENHLYDCYTDNEINAIISNHKEKLAEEFYACDHYDDDTWYEITSDYCYENIEKYKEMIDGE